MTKIALAIALLTSACAYGEMRQVLRAQVASEADCPDIKVLKSSPYQPGYQENQYTVKGCGIDRIYSCRGDGIVRYGHADCSYVPGATAVKPAAVPAPAAPAAAPSDEDTDEPADDENN